MRLLIYLLSVIVVIGCSYEEKNNILSDSKMDKKIVWEVGGHLPAQTGMEKNIGVSGLLYGSLQDKYIVAGGGGNFPYESTLNGGAKKLYSDIYMLEDNNGALQVIEHINWENEIGHGASITTKEGIYYIGGASNPQADDDILFISLKDNKLSVEKVGDLPFTFQNGAAVEKDGKLYIIAGRQNGKAANEVYQYDLSTKETKKLSPVPNQETRTQPIAQLLNGSIYVFSGADSIAYTDGYKYDFSKDAWEQVSDISITNKENITLAGGVSIKLNESEMVVMGGVNKNIYDNAVYNLNNLKGEELSDFKYKYFTSDPYEFKLNSDILIYNSKTDSWKTLGEVPFNPTCGQGLILIGNKIYFISGEIKAGIRTDKMYIGTILKRM
ncbi:cyclically-permuted mutarotase family protein [uncultured Brachyspira sp.]|uniref:cyclically-permuted mutarotase family protein n=1 Tax=uncultured Brachyspira sp. TaxID=221953 RepID=UPI0025E121BC|nr:cyclically-permuted mutarotase family protein [uncultured Brachyspira sp.]